MRIVVVLLVLLVGTARADDLRPTATGFDHIFHDRNLIVKGTDALPCAKCHTEQKGKLVGKPGHSACFGACHGPAPVAPKRGGKLVFGERAKVCMNCHAEAAQATPYPGKLKAAYPPYGNDPDFNIMLGHQQHGTVACTQCHDMRANPPKRQPHDRCAGCHDGAATRGHGPAMSKCMTCHPQAVGNPTPPELAVVRDSVSATFSHAKHASRGTAGKDCMTCHAAIKTTDDTQLPRPTMQSCGIGACHDGKAAFATTQACTRCHTEAPDRYEVERPTSRFLHTAAVHADTVAKRPCIACHALGPRGDTLVTGHASCADAGCHDDEFAQRRPKFCGACHNATEPWRPLVADRAPAERTEFGAMLDHDKHPKDCARCHSLRTASAQLRPPRGHAGCTGSGCHAAKSGPVPTLETCSGCHREGLASARDAARLRAPWSVRATFDHATHAKGRDGAALPCTSCHTMLPGTDLVALPTPAKASCAPCHDGKASFKLTGTSCTRCHPGTK